MKVELYKDYFENKKWTTIGLGLLGRGVMDTDFLARNKSEVIVTDIKSDIELKKSVEALSHFEGVAFHFGKNIKFSDFENRDFILKSAGVRNDNAYLIHSIENKIPVMMSLSLTCKIIMDNLKDVRIIGVTGTRGKTTTTELIYHILKYNNKNVFIGGNVRGVANFPILEKIENGDYLVLEIDSWQLQGFGDMNISPHIAVFTSFLDDHMNYYDNDKSLYFKDKSYIYKNQKEGDILIASKQAEEEIQKYDRCNRVVVPNNNLEINLIGSHNQVSATLAYEVAKSLGLEDKEIRESIKSFVAVEGRLQDMGEIKGVRIFNDNNSTTPDSAIQAIVSVFEKFNKKPIMILGGSDKGLDLTNLEEKIKSLTKTQIFLSGSGTNKLNLEKVYEFDTLEECIKKAFEVKEDGDIILFSPAFASFSKYFNNEYERNDLFVKIIKKYATI